MVALLLAAALLGQEESMDVLLRRFGDDDPSRRDEATKAIADRWASWSDGDLAKLRRGAEDPDRERSERAREALATVSLRRRLGAKLLAEIPGLEDAIRGGGGDARLKALGAAVRAWLADRVDDKALRVLCDIATEGRWTLTAGERCALPFPPGERAVPPLSPLVAPLLKDEDAEARASAADALGRLRAREYAAPVAALLKEADKKPRLAAIDALADMGACDQAPAVAVMLDPTEAYEIRLAAVRALDRLGAVAEFAAKIVPMLADGAPGVVGGAADALGRTSARDQAPRVAELLRGESVAVRLAAVGVLGRMGAIDQAPAVAALLREPSAEASGRLTPAAIEALGRMGAREQAALVAPFLKDQDEILRGAAVQALGRMGAIDRAPLIIPLLNDPSTVVCWKAVRALGDLLTPETSGDVAALLASDAHIVHGLAATVLGRVGAAARADAIAALLDEGQPFVRAEAAKALAALGARKHLKGLIPLLGDDFEEVRTDAALALCRFAGTELDKEEASLLYSRLEEATRGFSAAARVAAQVALACHSQGGKDQQRRALKELRESGQDFADALFDGLAAIYEKAAVAKLARPLTLDRPVDGMARLREVLESVGLKLDGAESLALAGRVPAGTRTTARRLLQSFWESEVVVPDGDRVRILGADGAFDVWQARLAGK